MAEKSGLFNAQSDEPAYTDYDVASFLELLVQGTGVLQGYKNELEVTSEVGLQVQIASGGAWLGDPSGWWYINDGKVTIDVDEQETDNRIDRVILRMDRNDDERNITLQILKGTAATEPAIPALTQNSTVYEISLAQIYVTEGSTTLIITDERGSEICEWLSVGNTSVIKCPSDIAKGYCGLYEDGSWVVTQKGIGVSDGSNIISQGICKLDGLTPEFNYYAQDDGTIGLTTTQYPVGFALDQNNLFVNIQGVTGKSQAYTDNMLYFNALPSNDSVQIQAKMPDGADGYQIKNMDTGDVLADLSIDYMETEWYEITGLTAGLEYNLKFIPYISDTLNEIEGENETNCTAGGLHRWYTFNSEDVEGATLNNVVGNGVNGTNASVSFTAGVVGNAGVYNGTNSFTILDGMLTAAEIDSDFSVSFSLLKPTITGLAERILGFYDARNLSISVTPSGNLYVNIYNGTSYSTTCTHTVPTQRFVDYVIVRSKTKGVSLYQDGEVDGVSSFTNNAAAYSQHAGIAINYSGDRYDGIIDNLRIYTRTLTQNESNNLHKELTYYVC